MAKRYPSCIMATCVLPWTEAGLLDEERFRHEIRTIRDRLTTHIYLFGTAGEGYAVTDAQFEQAARIFREETDRPDVDAVLGCISLSTPTVVERIELGRALGFDAFQISLPCWKECDDEETDRFFAETCGRFPDCRFMHYNLPRAKRLLDGDDYARLAAAHPNLVAVKTGGPDDAFLRHLLDAAPEIQFFFGGPVYARFRDVAECGHLISLAVVNFSRARRFFESRGDELAASAAELADVRNALFDAVGPTPRIDGAYDKLLWKVHDPAFPLRLLPPYTGSTEEMFARFVDALPDSWRPDVVLTED